MTGGKGGGGGAPHAAEALRILYEDGDLVAVDKEAGLPVIPERWDREKPDLLALLAARAAARGEGRLYVVHRIDRDASGVVLFARTAEAHRRLCLQFERREVEKEYAAVVAGRMAQASGTIDLPIFQRGKGPVRAVIRPDGKPSLTAWEAARLFPGATLLRCMPRTGRPNQIRVHLAAVGHPILCDPLYNKPAAPVRDGEGNVLLGRLALHAARLAVVHPSRGGRVVVAAPLPPDMERCVAFLGGG